MIPMREPKGDKALREDMLIPSLMGKPQRFMGMLFYKGLVILRHRKMMGKSQMAQTLSLFVLIADSSGNLAHPLKICNGFIVFGQEKPDQPTSFIE